MEGLGLKSVGGGALLARIFRVWWGPCCSVAFSFFVVWTPKSSTQALCWNRPSFVHLYKYEYIYIYIYICIYIHIHIHFDFYI